MYPMVSFCFKYLLCRLSSSLQPQCPGPQQVPPLIAPPIVVSPDMVSAPPTPASPDMVSAPAPSPFQIGGAPIDSLPASVVPSTSSNLVFPPSANGPSGTSSRACILVNPLSSFSLAMVLVLFLKVMFPFL
ncbi:hypothetical protein HanOQP8_Chr12g0441221 [Helianthus annuus]|nr:hypothetical protein HanOQP8_Chr12g0441221 [Helianthus annuus]